MSQVSENDPLLGTIAFLEPGKHTKGHIVAKKFRQILNSSKPLAMTYPRWRTNQAGGWTPANSFCLHHVWYRLKSILFV